MHPRNLTDFHGPSRGSGEEMNYMSCPVCGSTNWKVYLNPITGLWFCFGASHQGGGCVQSDDFTDDARQELLRLMSVQSLGRVPTQKWPELDLPPWMPLTPLAQTYLSKRGILASTWGALGIVEMRQSPRVLIPYRGPNGRNIYWTGRAYTSWSGDAPKYMSAPGRHPLYMLSRWEAVPMAVLVEGPFDAIAVWQATGVPAVAIGGKSLSKRVEFDLRKLVRDRLVVMLDSDAHAAAITVRDKLMDQYEISIAVLEDGTDPADSDGDVLRHHAIARK